MVSWILIGTLSVAVVILAAKQIKRTTLDKTELQKYEEELTQARTNLSSINYQCNVQNTKVQELEKKYYTLLDQYKQELNKKTIDLDLYFENQKQIRQSEIEVNFEKLWREKEENLNNKYIELEREELEKEHQLRKEVQDNIDIALKSQEKVVNDTQYQRERYEALLEPIRMYETDLNEKLFYTVQVPEQAKEDIDYLINFAAKQVHNPDIVSKIIWSEYVKPYLDQTFKRIEIKEEPGIYKITNITNGKSYIGKSTNVKRRITDHYKGACGISTVSKQLVHDEMAATGLWNWTIEIIIYCEKDKLSDLEKYYINFFESNTWGFNKTKGGEG